MLYLGENKINKLGNGNKIYLGDRLIYQAIHTPSASLPDVPFMFNYNAKQYSNGVMPNADGALFAENCVLTSPEYITHNGDSIVLTANNYFQYNWDSSDANPFNRSEGQPLTIIAKVIGVEGELIHLFANRSNFLYNYMFRIGSDDIAWLHTANSPELTVPFDFLQPNIITIRCGNDNYGFMENRTLNVVGEQKYLNWGYDSNGIALFAGYSTDISGETFNGGEFYWIYISNEQLTDDEIEQVIIYNETM